MYLGFMSFLFEQVLVCKHIDDIDDDGNGVCGCVCVY